MLKNLFAGEYLSTGGAGDESRGLGAVKRGYTGDRALYYYYLLVSGGVF